MNNKQSNNSAQTEIDNKDFNYYWREIIRALIAMK